MVTAPKIRTARRRFENKVSRGCLTGVFVGVDASVLVAVDGTVGSGVLVIVAVAVGVGRI